MCVKMLIYFQLKTHFHLQNRYIKLFSIDNLFIFGGKIFQAASWRSEKNGIRMPIFMKRFDNTINI